MASVAAGGDGGVHRIAATGQDTQPGLGGQGCEVATTLRANTGIRVVG